MKHVHRQERSYDHRLREAIAITGNANLFADVVIPISTRRTWAGGEFLPTVVSSDNEVETYVLLDRVQRLRARVKMQGAVIALLMRILTFCGGRVDVGRVPDGKDKGALLRTLGAASKAIGIDSALKVVGLSQGRYRA
jgi:hypothetical protein